MKIVYYCCLWIFLSATTAYAQDLSNIGAQRPVTLTGSLSSQAGVYQAKGISPRGGTSIWNLQANASLNLWNTVKVPFAFTIGRTGSNFNYPTFAQFGISPSYKWATAHLGYRNLNFSPYTLAGHTFLGAAIELKPGKFRFTAMQGRLRNAAEVDTTRSFIEPAFKRTAFGFKAGIGTEETYVDFIFFKGKDDENSLVKPEPEAITPAENVVIGLNANAKIFGNLKAEVDLAGSAFTRNQSSSTILPGDFYDNVESLVPQSIFTTRLSSRFNLAGKVGLAYTGKSSSLRLGYERIDPDYQTMGAYFFANDLERITVSPRLELFKNTLTLGGSLGLQRNNLLNNRLETTTRNVGSALLDYHPSPGWGVNASYSNYSIYQESGNISLNDTAAFNLSTTTYSVNPRITIQGTKTMQNWMVLFNHQRSNQDNAAFFATSHKFISSLASLNYTLVFLGSQTTFNAGVNYNSFSVAETETVLTVGVFSVGKSFFDQKVNLSFSGSYNRRRLNGTPDGATLSGYLSAGYQAAAAVRFNLNAGYLRDTGAAGFNFSETRATIGCTYRFIPRKKELSKEGKS